MKKPLFIICCFLFSSFMISAQTNLALGKSATQFSPQNDAGKAVDGNTDGNYNNGSVTHTNQGANPWWEVDLEDVYDVTTIKLYNRTDCCKERLKNFTILISETPFGSDYANNVGVAFARNVPYFRETRTLTGNKRGRYVRVFINGNNKILSLAEVEVYGTPSVNIAKGKSASQFSPQNAAGKAVDGFTDGNYYNGSVTHTNQGPNPWWEVDLGAVYDISTIKLYNRTDCCDNRLNGFTILVSETRFTDNSGGSAFASNVPFDANPIRTFLGSSRGQYVRIYLNNPGYLSLAEVEIFGVEKNELCDLDKSKMIPLKDATYRAYQFTAKLTGRAIKGNTPYEINFDTGSLTTSIPGGALDLSQITILEENVKDSWGRDADKVSGQLILESVDGTPYVIDDYVFYAVKNANGTYAADDRTAIYGNSIMGAFPSIGFWSVDPSFPYVLATKYASENLGFGIVTDCRSDAESDGSSSKSYLQIGIDPQISSQLKWRTDVPNWRTNITDFSPEAVPGFKVMIHFSDAGDTPVIETSDNLMSTIDTGAPDLTLRLGADDPQNNPLFASHFINDGPWKGWGTYDGYTKSLLNAKVTVEFTDSLGEKNSYTFPVGDNAWETPSTLYAGDWDSNVPWPVSQPQKPKNRINLGNTIYNYCPVYFYDIKNKRVGIGF